MRPIRTYYMNGGNEPIRVTASGSEANAVANAVRHAHSDEYGASIILVCDNNKGKDLIVIKVTPKGMNILYQDASRAKRKG